MEIISFKEEKYEENLQEQRDEIFALQSIFNTEDEEKLKLLSEVTEEKEGQFTILIAVSPKPLQETLVVNVALAAVSNDEDEMEGAAAAPIPTAASSPPQMPSNVQLCRSLSGRQWQGSFEVKFLMPLNLVAAFPPTYPSSSPPNLTLTCDWLTRHQLASLESGLQSLWSEACNMPVVFTWVDWLENSCLEHLGISSQLMLHPPGTSQAELDGAASLEMEGGTTWGEDVGLVVAAMVRYNQEQLDEEFCQTMHLCEICYMELPGTQFFRMNVCPHAFCHECMQAFCHLHVTAGTVEELRCPIQKCDTVVPPHIIQGVLPEEAYKRWEQLLLQKTLDAMEDTVYCPRCGSVVIVEEDRELNLAHCTVCFFAFCTQCERGWHQGRNCETEEDLLEQMQTKNEDNMSEAVQKRYAAIRRKLEEEMKSKTLRQKSTRPCPHCRIPVEKIGGCNKITCKCGTFFCWICGKKINGYEHFRTGSCILFPGQRIGIAANAIPVRRVPDAVVRMQAIMEVNPAMANNQCRCPVCKQGSLKGEDRNNHIKCWNCKTNYCFVCGQRIVGLVRAHFAAGPCDQHS